MVASNSSTHGESMTRKRLEKDIMTEEVMIEKMNEIVSHLRDRILTDENKMNQKKRADEFNALHKAMHCQHKSTVREMLEMCIELLKYDKF